jgi:hypothetical protein
MKFIHVLKIIILTVCICGFAFKTRAQQLASQKPLSSVYSQRVKDWLAINKKPRPQLSSLQDQRNLPSVKPIPKQASGLVVKNAVVARNAALPVSEKIKKLPSKSALTVHQLADRKPAGQKPSLR